MKILVVSAHPVPESFNNAVRAAVLAQLADAGHEIRHTDLNSTGFDPVMTADERRAYHTAIVNEEPVRAHLDDLLWCELLVFVYPTWWYGLPAILKGWLDRVFIPHVTFKMPEPGKPIRSNLTNVKGIAAITTCGSPWWWIELVIGNPGRRTLLRGLKSLAGFSCRTLWLCHYRMDHSTPQSRAAYLDKVGTRLARYLARFG